MLFILLAILYFRGASGVNNDSEQLYRKVFWLKNNNILHQPAKFKSALDLYCYPGKKIKAKFLLSSAKVRLEFNKMHKSNYLLFKDLNVSKIYRQYREANANWYNLFPSWRPTKVNLEPFKLSCLGISTKEEYSIIFNFFVVDYIKMSLLIGGIIMYVMADKLAKNELFYYIFGILFGICTSIMVVVYLISRLVPKRSAATYLILASGWSFGLFVLQYIWENIQLIINLYSNYVAAYMLVIGLISFFICYYKGPLNNPRTLRIIKWAIQALSFVLLYFSASNLPEASLCLIFGIIMLRQICGINSKFNPLSIIKQSVQLYLLKKFPPKVKLLTQEEYDQQGFYETQKALEGLKQYCYNSQTHAWKYAKILKDPKKFASFIEGDSTHVSQAELEEWEIEEAPHDGLHRKRRRSPLTCTFDLKPSAPPSEGKCSKDEKSKKYNYFNNSNKAQIYPSLNRANSTKKRIGDYLGDDYGTESDDDSFGLEARGANANLSDVSDGSESDRGYSDIEI